MSTSPSDPGVEADYYDGRSARPQRVRLRLAGGRLEVSGETLRRSEEPAGVRVSEPMGAAPRLVTFADGSHCEVRDHAAFAALLTAGGHRDGWVVRLQGRWLWAVLAALLAVATVAAGYRWGLPAASEWLAYRVPERLVQQLGGGTLDLLDRSVFAPSRLPEARRQALTARFAGLETVAGPRPAYRLAFRDGGGIGANALALPDGTLVVTDQLVALAGDDREILAVLAHELGHLDRRHSLRRLIQGTVVGLALAWYTGDTSSLAAALPAMLLEAGYSREHEREADAYAAAMLSRNGIAPDRLADILARLEAAHGGGAVPGYLATHPDTRERIAALRGTANPAPGR